MPSAVAAPVRPGESAGGGRAIQAMRPPAPPLDVPLDPGIETGHDRELAHEILERRHPLVQVLDRELVVQVLPLQLRIIAPKLAKLPEFAIKSKINSCQE